MVKTAGAFYALKKAFAMLMVKYTIFEDLGVLAQVLF